ncbi:acyltransferase family protein [Paraburkholderia phytofirmans]|nr:acyltransferase [Paraburkholderia phytofirmans]
MLENIQAARALAALAVVAYHMKALPVGQYGVDIFFVISGFIMSYIAPKEGLAFFRKRVIRIVPVYWLSTIGVYLVAIFRPYWLNTTTASGIYLVKSLFFIPYIQENGHWGPLNLNGWTLECEMLFYLTISATLLLVRHRYATTLAGAGLAAVCLLLPFFNCPQIFFHMFRPIIIEFCFGILCFWIFEMEVIRSLPAWIWAITSMLSIISIPFIYGVCGVVDSSARVVAYGIPSFIFVASLLGMECQGLTARSKLIGRLGASSYSIYLLHPYIIGVTRKIFHIQDGSSIYVDFVSLIGVSGIVCIIGYGFYFYIERPLLSRIVTVLARGRISPVASS